MKRKIAALLAMVVLAMTLAGCGKFTCDLCGEEKTGKQHTNEVFGTICDDCYKELKELASMF